MGKNDAGPEHKALRVGQLRAIGYVSLAHFSGISTLWIFGLRSWQWQAVLLGSQLSFVLSWLVAVLGVKGSARGPEDRAGFVGPKAAMEVTRGAFLLGVLGFTAFFFLNSW